jgi:hypothetical protein
MQWYFGGFMEIKTNLQRAILRKLFNDKEFINTIKNIDFKNKDIYINDKNIRSIIKNITHIFLNTQLDDFETIDTLIQTEFDPLLSIFDIRFLGYIDNSSIDIPSLMNNTQLSSVLSIDIRKSTELMLKADNANSFSLFITELIENMMKAVVKNFGIIEKFTGDGLLAFFPEFYSGSDCCCHAVNAAIDCHNIFENIYNKSNDKFVAAIVNTGLGIGIDYGDIIIKNINNSTNIIGKPVVYACRMSGIDPKKTAVNIKAYEKIILSFPNTIFYPERLDLKTGECLKCYSIIKPIVKAVIPTWAT